MISVIGLPETPPETKIPIITPMPQPQLMAKKSPFFESLSFDWATHPIPKIYENQSGKYGLMDSISGRFESHNMKNVLQRFKTYFLLIQKE